MDSVKAAKKRRGVAITVLVVAAVLAMVAAALYAAWPKLG